MHGGREIAAFPEESPAGLQPSPEVCVLNQGQRQVETLLLGHTASQGNGHSAGKAAERDLSLHGPDSGKAKPRLPEKPASPPGPGSDENPSDHQEQKEEKDSRVAVQSRSHAHQHGGEARHLRAELPEDLLEDRHHLHQQDDDHRSHHG